MNLPRFKYWDRFDWACFSIVVVLGTLLIFAVIGMIIECAYGNVILIPTGKGTFVPIITSDPSGSFEC